LTVDAACVPALGPTIPFPASHTRARDIVPGVRQHMRTSFLPDFEGNDAVRFEDFFCRLVAEVSFPLIRCFRVPEQFVIIRSADSRADRFDGVNSPILRGGLYILVCLSAPLSSVTLFSTNPAPATSPPRENSGAFSSVNSTSISRRLKSKQRFGNWATFWSSNQIADLSLFGWEAANWQREGALPLKRSWKADRFYPPGHQERLYRILGSPQSPLAVTIVDRMHLRRICSP
jgi:hypothetical protein